MIEEVIRHVTAKYPEILPMLKGRALAIALCGNPKAYKTYEIMLEDIIALIEDTHDGNVGTSSFVSEMANIISGQMVNAFHNAWIDSDYGGEGVYTGFPDYLQSAQEDFISRIIDTQHIYQLYNDIIQARLQKTPVDALTSRADMWANRWNEAYNEAMRVISAENGDNMVWVLGDADHCDTCLSLSGIVASADEWAQSQYQPQGGNLDCGGYRCKCSLVATKEKRTRGRQRILGI